MTAPTLPDQATFTLAEVAEITGFTVRSIQEACAADPPRIAHRHFGRQRVLTREQLAAFIASTQVEPHALAALPDCQACDGCGKEVPPDWDERRAGRLMIYLYQRLQDLECDGWVLDQEYQRIEGEIKRPDGPATPSDPAASGQIRRRRQGRANTLGTLTT